MGRADIAFCKPSRSSGDPSILRENVQRSSSPHGPIRAPASIVGRRMKCPHCEKSVRPWAPQINPLSDRKECPHCGKPVSIAFNFGLAIILALLSFPVVYLGVHAGMPQWLLTLCATLVVCLLVMKLTPKD
jgi:hypothetical protein